MTKQELIEAISEMLGLEVTEHPTRKYGLEVRSPVNGALLFDMELRQEEDRGVRREARHQTFRLSQPSSLTPPSSPHISSNALITPSR